MVDHKRGVGLVFIGIVIAMLSGCQTREPAPPPPTLFVMPTLLPTETRAPILPATETLTPSLSPTTMQTLSPTQTPMPTATFTPAATNTLTPTLLPSPTASLTPVILVIQSEVGAYVRSGPGVNYPIVGEVGASAMFDTLAYTIDAEGDAWYLIELADGTLAWISQWVAGRVDDVPLGLIALAATVPASPTPLPTDTPTATPTITPTATLPAGANARIYPDSRVNLRTGPGLDFDKRGTVDPHMPLQLIGRNPDNTWFEINTFDGRSGWVRGDLITIEDLSALPVTGLNPPAGIVVSPDALNKARQIFARGQQVGRRANALIVIGDSTSAASPTRFTFFYSFPRGIYNLGPYGQLQPTVTYFLDSGSLGVNFLTAQTGFTTRHILETTWADPAFCQPGETVLMCQIRLSQPVLAIIYIGNIDMMNHDPAAYRQNLAAIIDTLVSSGVIPVLTTFSIDVNDSNNARFVSQFIQHNAIIRELAGQYNVPLIEFRQAAVALPEQGTGGGDSRHLSFRGDGSMDFGEDSRLGQALRERMTLQMLDVLRQYVLTG